MTVKLGSNHLLEDMDRAGQYYEEISIRRRPDLISVLQAVCEGTILGLSNMLTLKWCNPRI